MASSFRYGNDSGFSKEQNDSQLCTPLFPMELKKVIRSRNEKSRMILRNEKTRCICSREVNQYWEKEP